MIMNMIKKMNQIKKFAENLTGFQSQMPEIMTHDVLIKDKIDVHKYLVGLILPGTDGMYDNIQNILNEYGYKNIKIFTTSKLPDLKDLNI